jgi:hypothetical protein
MSECTSYVRSKILMLSSGYQNIILEQFEFVPLGRIYTVHAVYMVYAYCM